MVTLAVGNIFDKGTVGANKSAVVSSLGILMVT